MLCVDKGQAMMGCGRLRRLPTYLPSILISRQRHAGNGKGAKMTAPWAPAHRQASLKAFNIVSFPSVKSHSAVLIGNQAPPNCLQSCAEVPASQCQQINLSPSHKAPCCLTAGATTRSNWTTLGQIWKCRRPPDDTETRDQSCVSVEMAV